MKKMTPQEFNTFELQNAARKEAGLPAMKIRIRNCMNCGSKFESYDKYYCGCERPKTTYLSGLAIV